ncbi:TPA: hypothetical protein N3Z55_003688 [Salmonella enterica subsp. houtenae serovar 44:z36,Z38:-]|nr:hypothetical protein [Salmonella enterica subsp. houtenae serovar 44:z36,Z38:-]
MNNTNRLLSILGAAIVAVILTTSAARGDSAAFPFNFVMDGSWDGGNGQHYPYFITYFSTNSTSVSYSSPGTGVIVGTNPVASSVNVFVAAGGKILPSTIKLNNCVTLEVTRLQGTNVSGKFGNASSQTAAGLLALNYSNMYGVNFGNFFVTNAYRSEVTGQTIVDYRLTRSCNDDSATNMVYLRAASLYQDKVLASIGCLQGQGCGIPLPPSKQNSCTASSSNLQFDFGTVFPGSQSVLNLPGTKTITLTCTEPFSGTFSSSRAGKSWNMDNTLNTEEYVVSSSALADVTATISGVRRSETEYAILMVPKLVAKTPGKVNATDVLTIQYN